MCVCVFRDRVCEGHLDNARELGFREQRLLVCDQHHGPVVARHVRRQPRLSGLFVMSGKIAGSDCRMPLNRRWATAGIDARPRGHTLHPCLSIPGPHHCARVEMVKVRQSERDWKNVRGCCESVRRGKSECERVRECERVKECEKVREQRLLVRDEHHGPVVPRHVRCQPRLRVKMVKVASDWSK